jgi:hypothetical protein
VRGISQAQAEERAQETVARTPLNDFTKPQEAKEYMNSPEKIGRCIRLVGKTAALVKDMLSREDAKSSSAGVKSSSR